MQRIEHPAKTSKISARLPQNIKKTVQKTTRNNLFSPPKSKENTVQKFLYFLPFLCLAVEEYLIKLLIENKKKD